MESKKKENLRVERYSGIFMQVGLLMALATTFVAFKWESKPTPIVIDNDFEVTDEPIVATLLLVEKKMKRPLPKKKEKEPIKRPNDEIVVITPVENLPFDSVEFDPFEDDSLDFEPSTVMAGVSVEVPEPPVVGYESLSKLPQFPGGMEAFTNFLRKNLVYPPFEQQMGIPGQARVQFVIDEQGEIESVQIVSGTRKNFSDEALRVAKKIPRWVPGEQFGKKVKCRYEVPINFRMKKSRF